MASEIRLQVLSYSHATGKREDGTVAWDKLLANDLSVHVHGSAAGNENLILTIMHGIKPLERIDIAALVSQAHAVLASIQKAGGHPIADQLPISGMFKEHIFAFKYRLPDGKVRRIQLRFPNTNDCQRLVRILTSRGVDFQELRPGTARPGTARPTTSSSSSQLPGHRPQSSNHGSTISTMPRPFAPQTLEAGSLSARHHASSQLPSTYSYSNTAGPHITRDEVLAPRDVRPDRLTTAHIYRATTTAACAPPTQPEAFRFDHQAAQSQVVRPGSSSHLENLKAIRESAEQFQSPLHSDAIAQPPFWSNAQNHGSAPDNTHSDNVTPITSMTASSDGLHNGSPAKQSLSFDRPGPPMSTSYSGVLDLSMQSQMQPHSSVNGFHSQYKDPLVSSKEAFDNRPGTALPLQQPQSAANQSSARPQTAGIFRHNKPAEPSFMSLGVDFATGNNSTNANSGASTSHESHEATVDDYAAQSPQDRQAALEEWMIGNLNNPAFAKLCEDVGNCWRRMALGL